MTRTVQPVLILPENYVRTVGRDALRTNIMAARLVAETVRTTLGPRGMDKMLVDELGDITVTNDGVTILEQMEVVHPAAKLLVEVAKTQEEEVGDGTTTAVVIAGELLKNAEELLDMGIHPTVIAEGYRKASDQALKILDEIAEKVSKEDTEVLKKIARTAMTGKVAELARDFLADLVVDAVQKVTYEVDGKTVVDLDSIKIEKKIGGGVEDTELIHGVVIDKERVHPGMPKVVKNAKIALINGALEVKETEIDARINITSPDQLEAFLRKEEELIKKMVDKIKEVGANVVFVQKGIDDLAAHYLAKYGILAVRRVKKSDMEKLAKATGARIVTNIDDLTPEDLGEAELVEEKKVAGENMIFVTGCKNPRAVTILIRGGTEHVIDEIERAITDAMKDVAAALKDGKVVAGGGAVEVEIAKRLRDWAQQLPSKEQLAALKFADSLEIIPQTLAENAGLDSIEIMAELRSRHEKGEKWAGVDVFEGKVADMWEKGVIEPRKVKAQAIKSATEAAIMILRIDDVIAAVKKEGGEKSKGPEEFGAEEE